MNKDLYHESVHPAPQYLQCCGKFQVIIERKRTYSHCENESGSVKSLCSLLLVPNQIWYNNIPASQDMSSCHVLS